MITYTLKVVEIKVETEDAITVCFKQPALKKLKYDAGQYLSLIFRINGRRYVRPYSFSSCSLVDNFIEITVKRVPKGIVSNHIIDFVKEGDMIEAMQPMGDFTYLSNDVSGDIYLWGVGSGITPLISLAKHILFSEEKKKVYLMYGNRNKESTIFLNQIEHLQSKYTNRFEVTHFHTRPTIRLDNPNLIQGRIDEHKVGIIINQNNNIKGSAHYICGPAGLKESVKKVLSELNVDKENIYSEDFELVRDPKDFSNIHTQKVKLKFNYKEFDLEVIKGKSILEAALDANLELPYSCQTGNCNTCKAIRLDGDLKMIGLVKERTDLKSDEYLLCCSYPLSGNVCVEI